MWQKCPICNGTGNNPNAYTSNKIEICTVCVGHKIINSLNGLPPNKPVATISSAVTNLGVVNLEEFYKELKKIQIESIENDIERIQSHIIHGIPVEIDGKFVTIQEAKRKISELKKHVFNKRLNLKK